METLTSTSPSTTRTIIAETKWKRNQQQHALAPSFVEYTNINMHPQVYPQRWVQLRYFLFLALVSDWICFSVAASPDTFEASSAGHSAASLIGIVFINVASCVLVTDLVTKIGLQRRILGAEISMTIGNWFQSGFAFLVPMAHAVG